MRAIRLKTRGPIADDRGGHRAGSAAWWLCAVVLPLGAACASGGQKRGGADDLNGKDSSANPPDGAGGGSSVPPGPPPGKVAPATAIPATPVTDLPDGFVLTDAPDFSEPVMHVPNRSSVMLFLPFVQGAGDYRVYAVADGVRTEVTAGNQRVIGATIHCAGLRQRNTCDDGEAITEYGRGSHPVFSEAFYVPPCREDVRTVAVPKSVLRQVEVNGLSGTTQLVVEAIDALCPFPGVIGSAHADVPILGTDTPVQSTYQGESRSFTFAKPTFPVRTADEIRQEYGSLIVNGHGPAGRPSDPLQGPFLNIGQPAPPSTPRVLARAIVSVTPTGTAERPEGFKETDIFDDFEDEGDQFRLLRERQASDGVILPEGWGPIGEVRQYENSKWNFYTFNGEVAQPFVAEGQLHSVLGDSGQDVMASSLFYPKRPVQIPDAEASYTHITFEVQTNATQRRYWWLHLCGAAEPGQTYDGTDIKSLSPMAARPFFMDPGSGPPISVAGWNCFQFVPRGGTYELVEGGELSNSTFPGTSRPMTDLRMLVNRPTPAGQDPFHDADSVILLDPSMVEGNTQALGGAWSRSWGPDKRINGDILDDQMFIQQRTRLDIFINRSRVVFFANGVQKACDDFATHRLTMAEAAVGFGHVIYHSSAERTELSLPDWIRTGQHYYRWNAPFVDARSFDNVGIREGVGLPETYVEGACYATPASGR